MSPPAIPGCPPGVPLPLRMYEPGTSPWNENVPSGRMSRHQMPTAFTGMLASTSCSRVCGIGLSVLVTRPVIDTVWIICSLMSIPGTSCAGPTATVPAAAPLGVPG